MPLVPPPLLCPKNVALRLAVSVSTARALMRDGLIVSIRTGRKGKLWRTSAAALQGYIERQRLKVGLPVGYVPRLTPFIEPVQVGRPEIREAPVEDAS